MVSENKILKIIIQEFPGFSNEITELFIESSNFLELCEDYVLCKISIKKLESLEDSAKKQEIHELKQMNLELKEELLSKIIKTT